MTPCFGPAPDSRPWFARAQDSDLQSFYFGEGIMFRLFVAFAIACSCTQAQAQKKMYRCGNQYQERPCEGPRVAPAAPAAARDDPQQQQEQAAKRQERELAVQQKRCDEYAEELGDIERRIKAGADEKLMDQYLRRQKEMKTRIAREC